MPANNGTTLPIRKNDAETVRLAAAHSKKTLVDYTSEVMGKHARKTLAKLGVPPYANTANGESKS